MWDQFFMLDWSLGQGVSGYATIGDITTFFMTLARDLGRGLLCCARLGPTMCATAQLTGQAECTTQSAARVQKATP